MKCRLQIILDNRGVMKGWLAQQVGISRNAMTEIIKGGGLRLEIALKIARALGLSVHDIWELEDEGVN